MRLRVPRISLSICLFFSQSDCTSIPKEPSSICLSVHLSVYLSLLICPSAYFALSVFVYNIPPRPSNRGYRASDWKLDAPDFTGRLKVVSRGEKLFIKVEDKVSGELFAQCPIEEYPGLFIIRYLTNYYYLTRLIRFLNFHDHVTTSS